MPPFMAQRPSMNVAREFSRGKRANLCGVAIAEKGFLVSTKKGRLYLACAKVNRRVHSHAFNVEKLLLQRVLCINALLRFEWHEVSKLHLSNHLYSLRGNQEVMENGGD